MLQGVKGFPGGLVLISMVVIFWGGISLDSISPLWIRSWYVYFVGTLNLKK